MQPSAPALGMPPSSKGAGGYGDDQNESVRDRPAFSIATGSGHLLTRLSLHGQGVRTIEGLQACPNLRVLVRLLVSHAYCLHVERAQRAPRDHYQYNTPRTIVTCYSIFMCAHEWLQNTSRFYRLVNRIFMLLERIIFWDL